MLIKNLNYINFIDNSGQAIPRDTIIYDSLKIKDYIQQNKSKRLVFLLMENSYNSLIFYASYICTKNVVVLLNSNINLYTLKKLINLYKPNEVIAKDTLEINSYKKIFSIGDFSCYKNKNEIDHNLHKDLCALLATSGTTGSSKFVRLSYQNILSNTKSICNFLRIKKSDILITTLPTDYTYGFSQINTHLYKGSTIVLNKYSVIQKKFWDLLHQTKSTTFGGVPYTYELMKRLDISKFNIDSIKYLTQAGGKLDAEKQLYFFNLLKKNKSKFIIMYGSTEATSRMSFLPWSNCSKKLESIGKAIPGGKFRINYKNTDVKKKVGELVYYGRNVSLGYSTTYDDLHKGDENKGKLNTGDLAYEDKDQFYYIVGRIRRFIKLFGHRINLDDLEHILRDKCKDINIFCKGNDKLLKVFLTNTKNVKKIEDILIKYFNINKLFFKIQLIKNIPLNNSGKIIYSKL